MCICNAVILTPDIEAIFILLTARTHTWSQLKEAVRLFIFMNVIGVETSLEHYTIRLNI